MMRTHLLTAIAFIGLAAPVTGITQSYMTPEQVLQQNNGAFLVPGHQRGAEWAANLQAQQSIDRHPSIIREPWDPVVDNGVPPVPASELQYIPQPFATGGQYQGLDPTTARLLARLAQQNSILASTLNNSGAPLSQTGPAATLMAGVMIVATILTLRRAKVLERFVREL